MLAGGNPVLLGARVDLEDVGPRAEDGLLTAQEEEEEKRSNEHLDKGLTSEVRMCNCIKRHPLTSLLSDIY